MFHTAEIRWFLEGSPTGSVRDWFAEAALARDEDPRIDSYLLLPGCTTCGAKIRKGHFEIKAQTNPPEPVSYSNGIAGKRVAWVKWSSGLAGAQLVQEQQGPETWVQVEKSRTLRLFELADAVEERPAGEWLAGSGCFIELATLRIAEDAEDWSSASHWWSVCLEAFGAQGQVAQLVDRMASADVLQTISAELPAEFSMSYPEWLVRIHD
jgi:hypothetical protein